MNADSLLELLKNDPSDKDIRLVINTIKSDFHSNPEVAAKLAKILTDSGTHIFHNHDIVADVASTGGPGSLSTLVTPLFLRAGGAVVPKLGVPGRPAGGIDCLAQIPSYKVSLNSDEVATIVNSGGYAHFLASNDMAPLDGRMFVIRQEMNAQAVPTLVCASILSKKLAVGVQYSGLDIRVSPNGNFGEDWEAATENARLFIKTAKLLLLKAAPVLTDGTFPGQPYLGRREALFAINTYFAGVASDWVIEHIELCRSLALSCLPESCRFRVASAVPNELISHFAANLVDQGSNLDDYNNVISEVMDRHIFYITADSDGFCRYPLHELRDIIVEQQKAMVSNINKYPDPIGLVFTKKPGAWVAKGEVIATARIETRDRDAIFNKLHTLIGKPMKMPFALGMEAISD